MSVRSNSIRCVLGTLSVSAKVENDQRQTKVLVFCQRLADEVGSALQQHGHGGEEGKAALRKAVEGRSGFKLEL